MMTDREWMVVTPAEQAEMKWPPQETAEEFAYRKRAESRLGLLFPGHRLSVHPRKAMNDAVDSQLIW